MIRYCGYCVIVPVLFSRLILIGFFLVSPRRFVGWRRLFLGTLAPFGLSHWIKILQLVLHMGFFELTDLVLNTVGRGVGAGINVMVRKVSRREKSLN